MHSILDTFKRYSVSPGTGIILLNLGILIVFFYQPEPGYYTWVTVVSRIFMVLSALGSLLYLVQKSDLSPKNLAAAEQIRFEDRGTFFLRFYQVGLPILILFLCGFILYLFRKEVAQDWYIAAALFMAALVQVKVLSVDMLVDPFVLRITDTHLSMNLKGYEEIRWTDVDQIEWDTEEMVFVMAEDLEHSLGFGKMIREKAAYVKAVQLQAQQHQIDMDMEGVPVSQILSHS